MLEFHFVVPPGLVTLPAQVEAAIDRAMAMAAQEEAIRERDAVAVASGKTRDSLKVRRSGRLEYEVAPKTTYAWFVEHGRPPGRMPAIAAIKRWCAIKGIGGGDLDGAAWAIARSIARRGTRRYRKEVPGFMPDAAQAQKIEMTIAKLFEVNVREFAA